MSATVEPHRVLATLATLVLGSFAGLGMSGCAKKANSADTTPAYAEPAMAEMATSDPLAELASLEGRMRQLGLTPAPSRRGAPEPGADKAGGGELAEETQDETTARERVGGQGQAAGTSAPQPTTTSTDSDDMVDAGDCEGESRCTSVCELSEAICDLEIRICTMANNHEGDPLYVDACERAVEDCELAGDACDTCTP